MGECFKIFGIYGTSSAGVAVSYSPLMTALNPFNNASVLVSATILFVVCIENALADNAPANNIFVVS